MFDIITIFLIKSVIFVVNEVNVVAFLIKNAIVYFSRV